MVKGVPLCDSSETQAGVDLVETHFLSFYSRVNLLVLDGTWEIVNQELYSHIKMTLKKIYSCSDV